MLEDNSSKKYEEQTIYIEISDIPPKAKSNIVRGLAGAILFALIGAIVGGIIIGQVTGDSMVPFYHLFSNISIFSILSAIGIALLTIEGYKIFKGKMNNISFYSLIFISIVMITIALCIAYTIIIYKSFQSYYGMFESPIKAAIYDLPTRFMDAYFGGVFIKNLVISYVITGVSSVVCVKKLY